MPSSSQSVVEARRSRRPSCRRRAACSCRRRARPASIAAASRRAADSVTTSSGVQHAPRQNTGAPLTREREVAVVASRSSVAEADRARARRVDAPSRHVEAHAVERGLAVRVRPPALDGARSPGAPRRRPPSPRATSARAMLERRRARPRARRARPARRRARAAGTRCRRRRAPPSRPREADVIDRDADAPLDRTARHGPTGGRRRRPARRAAEQGRAEPAQLLVLDHRRAPARPRALRGETASSARNGSPAPAPPRRASAALVRAGTCCRSTAAARRRARRRRPSRARRSRARSHRAGFAAGSRSTARATTSPRRRTGARARRGSTCRPRATRPRPSMARPPLIQRERAASSRRARQSRQRAPAQTSQPREAARSVAGDAADAPGRQRLCCVELVIAARIAVDALEHAALEHVVGELDVELAFEREHHVDAGVRGHARLIEVGVLGQRRRVLAEASVLA